MAWHLTKLTGPTQANRYASYPIARHTHCALLTTDKGGSALTSTHAHDFLRFCRSSLSSESFPCVMMLGIRPSQPQARRRRTVQSGEITSQFVLHRPADVSARAGSHFCARMVLRGKGRGSSLIRRLSCPGGGRRKRASGQKQARRA